MTADETRALILASLRARKALKDFADFLEYEASELLKLKIQKNWQEVALQMIASYIYNACKWTSDLFGHPEYERTEDDDRYPASQVRSPLITELNELPDLLNAQRLRGRKTISVDAFRVLLLTQPAGSKIVSGLHAEAIDRGANANADYGLGGKRERQSKPGSVFGFDNPAPLIDDHSTELRLMKRLFAQAHLFEKSGLLQVDSVKWKLTEPVVRAFNAARRVGEERHYSLADVRDNIDADGRDNLMECAGQAARLLEITFNITDQKTRGEQQRETVESWLHAAPLARLIIAIFEEMLPSKDCDLVDIRISKYKDDKLTNSAVTLAEEAIKCARRIVRLIPEFESVNLDAGLALLAISDEYRKSQKQLERDQLFEPLIGHPADDQLENRLEEGRSIIVKEMWQLRQNIITIKAYAVFMNWYVDHARTQIPHDLLPAWKIVLRDIFYGLEDWSRELQARYDEGVLFTRDVKRRAGGYPLSVPPILQAVESHFIKLKRYPLKLAFHGEFRQGAIAEQNVLGAIVHALCETRPEAYEAWRRLTASVPPAASIQTAS